MYPPAPSGDADVLGRAVGGAQHGSGPQLGPAAGDLTPKAALTEARNKRTTGRDRAGRSLEILGDVAKYMVNIIDNNCWGYIWGTYY